MDSEVYTTADATNFVRVTDVIVFLQMPSDEQAQVLRNLKKLQQLDASAGASVH